MTAKLSAALSPIDAARSPGEDEPMESVVRYKFKSSTMEYSVAFSGPHIGVLELKKAIVTKQNMSAGSEDMHMLMQVPRVGRVAACLEAGCPAGCSARAAQRAVRHTGSPLRERRAWRRR